MAQPETRPLLGNELMFWGFDRCLPTNFAVFAQVRGPLSEDALEAALPKVQARHPLLQATLFTERGAPWFRPGAPALQLERAEGSLEDAVRWLSDSTFQRFDTARGPLVRALCMRHAADRATLAVVLHHTIGDGRSGVNVLRDWLRAVNHPGADLPPLPPHPSLAQALQSLGSLRARLRHNTQAQRWLKHKNPSSPAAWLAPEGKAPPHARRVVAHLLQLDADQGGALAARARAEGATVHGALHAAVGRSVAARLAGGAPTLSFGQPVDMRDQLAADARAVCGCMISAVAFKERVPKQQPFWELARRITRRVREARQQGVDRFLLDVGFPTLGGLARHLSAPLPRPFGRLMEAIHPQGLILSNLGRVAPPEPAGPLAVEHMGLAVNPGITSPLTHTATTVHGRVSWLFLATAPLISQDTLAALADDAHAQLRAATSPG